MGKFDKNGLATEETEVTIYHYDKNGELTGSSLYHCPAGTGLPAGSTRATPLPARENQTNVLIDGKWTVTDDFRGQYMFSIKTGKMYPIQQFGPIPEEFTLARPSSIYDEFINGKWVKNIDKERREIVQKNQSIRKALLLDANLVIDGTQDFIDSGVAPTSIVSMHKAWRNYRARLFLVSLPEPAWPSVPSQDIADYQAMQEEDDGEILANKDSSDQEHEIDDKEDVEFDEVEDIELDKGKGLTEDNEVVTQAD